MSEDIDRLKEQNAEMLQALHKIEKWADWGHCDACDAIAGLVETLIAKVEGQ